MLSLVSALAWWGEGGGEGGVGKVAIFVCKLVTSSKTGIISFGSFVFSIK